MTIELRDKVSQEGFAFVAAEAMRTLLGALDALSDWPNIKSGTTTVHDLDGNLLGSFTLTAPLDAAILDDARVKHDVTAVEAIDSSHAAYRDVLVGTFKAR